MRVFHSRYFELLPYQIIRGYFKGKHFFLSRQNFNTWKVLLDNGL